MTWSFQFAARSKEAALKFVATKMENVPQTVKDYVRTAVESLPPDHENRVIIGKGMGHLCYGGAGGGSYEETSAQINVYPLSVEPEPKVEAAPVENNESPAPGNDEVVDQPA